LTSFSTETASRLATAAISAWILTASVPGPWMQRRESPISSTAVKPHSESQAGEAQSTEYGACP